MKVDAGVAVTGAISVPGDKSISHRSVLLGAICDGELRVTGFGRSEDTESSIRAVRALGAEVVEEDIDTVVIRGVGLRGFTPPPEPIDCGNSGTTVRLISGILAGQSGTFTLAGDESLSRRPMERIAGPLRQMGATVETTDGHLPMRITGGSLHGIEYSMPMASAQVKSAVLLAGLYATGRTTVIEPLPTRDHTENMLAAAGATVVRRSTGAAVDAPRQLHLAELEVPGDFSSAAPFIVAASIVPGSELVIQGVGLNPRRIGLLDVLERMGARISVFNRRNVGGERVGDLEVRSAELTATEVKPEEVPLLVDELPIFALAAAHAHGDSLVTGAEELRVKETDRVETTITALRALGVRAEERPDGFRVRGVPSRPRGGTIDAAGDHRIAMLGAVAGIASREGVEIKGADAVAVSFPGFFQLLDSVTQR